MPGACAQLGAQHEGASRLLALADMVNQAVGDALSGLLLVEAALARRAWGLREWAALYTDLPSRQLKACAPCCAHVRELLGGVAGLGMLIAKIDAILRPGYPCKAGLRARSCGACMLCDAPSCMSAQVKVADRSVVTTADAERRTMAPAGLQALIDAAIAAAPSGELGITGICTSAAASHLHDLRCTLAPCHSFPPVRLTAQGQWQPSHSHAGRAFVRPSGTEDVVRVYAEAATQPAANDLAVAIARHVHALAAGVGPPP